MLYVWCSASCTHFYSINNDKFGAVLLVAFLIKYDKSGALWTSASYTGGWSTKKSETALGHTGMPMWWLVHQVVVVVVVVVVIEVIVVVVVVVVVIVIVIVVIVALAVGVLALLLHCQSWYGNGVVMTWQCCGGDTAWLGNDICSHNKNRNNTVPALESMIFWRLQARGMLSVLKYSVL